MNGRALAAAALLIAALPAQGDRPARDASTRLYAARLCEVLDLDTAGAIARYQSVAVERGSNERWIAVARLEELRRLGVPVQQPVPAGELPAAIRALLARLTPLQPGELLTQAAKLPPEPLREGPGEGAALLDPHAASRETERWVRERSGPSVTERQRQRAASTRPSTAPIDETRVLAVDVLRRELEGRTQMAAGLRELYFRTWQPPNPGGTPAELLARVRSNLDAWIKEAKDNAYLVELLTRLKDEIEQRGATNATLALQLVQRLPMYADRLLAEPKADPGK